MFEYSICNQADENIFHKQCSALEKNIPNLTKKDLLEDVDGSLIQLYSLHDKRVSVHNSVYIGAVYVESDIDLTTFFNT